MKNDLKEQLADYEKEIIEAWHIAMGDKTIPFKITLTQLGLCAERVCQALYIRTYGKVPKKTFYQMINLFYKEKVFDLQLKTYMNTLRPASADRRHKTTAIAKAFTDLMRLNLVEIIRWYQGYTGIKLQGLKIEKYIAIIHKRPVYTYHKLRKKGHLSEENLEKNISNEKLISHDVSDKKILRSPVYASLVVDMSGSMGNDVSNVIEGHRDALTAIRGSMICKQGALFLMQHLFNYESHLLNSLTNVHKSGNDDVVQLTRDNYQPSGTTALYDTLYEAINLICVEVDSLKNSRGRKPEIIIGVMTDGMDNVSNHNAEDIKKLMAHLSEEGVVKSSVVIGWTSKNLSNNDLQKLQSSLGFDDYISLEQSNPSAIRDGFQLWSQRVV